MLAVGRQAARAAATGASRRGVESKGYGWRVYNLMDVVRRQLFCRRIVRRDARYWMVRLYWNIFGRSRNGTATRLKLWWHQPKLGYGSISRSVRSEARTRSFLVRCLDLP